MADISEININDIPYSIKDTQARNTINSISTNYLPLSGGTLTGELTTSSHLTIKDNTLDTNSLEELWPRHFSIKDKDDTTRGYFEIYQQPDGTQGFQIEAQRLINDNPIYNGIRLAITSTGERLIRITPNAVTAWQNALQVLPLSGGTMTGNLVIEGNNSVGLEINRSEDSGRGGVFRFTKGDVTERVYVYQFKSNNTNYDLFKFPATDHTETSNGTYALLSTKNVVTIEQGGTGATSVTSGTGAVHNLFPTNLGTDIGFLAGLTSSYATTGYTKLPLAIALGGSGQDSITKTTGSRNTTNTTAGTINIYKWGKVVTVQSYNTLKLAEALAVHKSVAIGSIGSAYYPNYSMTAWAGNGTYPAAIYLSTTGAISLINYGTASIPTNTNIHFTVTYIID